jgi:hypothetical protein
LSSSHDSVYFYRRCKLRFGHRCHRFHASQ